MKRLLLVFLLLAGGCANHGTNRDEHVENQLTISKNYTGLIEHYKAQVVANDKDWDAQFKLAQAYFNNDDIESADFYVQRVLELADAPSAKAHLLKGRILAKGFAFDKALEEYDQAIALGLNDAQLYMQRGIALAQVKRYESAVDSFNIARLRGFDETSVKNNIAMVHIYQGDFQAAVDILLPVYEQDTSNSKVSSNLKLSMLKLEALEQSKQAKVNPEAKTPALETKSAPIEDETLSEAEVSEISAEEFFAAQAPINQQTKPKGRKYYIQLGAYDNMPEALQKRNELLDTQLPIAIRPTELSNSGTWYRLLTGEFDSYRQAQRFASNNKRVLASHDYFIQVIK
ncbi:SPOR domain-containing protein [Vibrio gallicus]|uniref:SPOR domain-containing protein n=1 Tax=Vibrio gallicus TaxID=190897 RepID=UPI0021C3DF41|nr:SPOR domain-containing protein [Vibrio gallicus]